MKFLIYIIIGWVVGLGALPTAFADSFDSKAREGVTLYNREKFDQAATKFQESQQKTPEDSNVAYNLANSHYRLGHYEEAVEAYKKSLTENTPKNLKQKSYYNMGNAYYRMGYMDEAIDSYKKPDKPDGPARAIKIYSSNREPVIMPTIPRTLKRNPVSLRIAKLLNRIPLKLLKIRIRINQIPTPLLPQLPPL